MEEPISEDEITPDAQSGAKEFTGIEVVLKVFEKTPYLIDINQLLDTGDDDAIWVFGVGGPA